MKPPKCRVCLSLHWPRDGHAFAINKAAINAAINSGDAVERAGTRGPSALGFESPEVAGSDRERGPAQPVRLGGGARDRGRYNAYLRFYMQARRAIASGKASRWPA